MLSTEHITSMPIVVMGIKNHAHNDVFAQKYSFGVVLTPNSPMCLACLPLLCTLICIYVAQITCICFVYVLEVVWVLRSVEIVLYRACIERVHRRVTYKLFSTFLAHVCCMRHLRAWGGLLWEGHAERAERRVDVAVGVDRRTSAARRACRRSAKGGVCQSAAGAASPAGPRGVPEAQRLPPHRPIRREARPIAAVDVEVVERVLDAAAIRHR
jgi:hypothetical protein